jgi:hypothetical protein
MKTETTLSPEETRDLQCVAGVMIPPSTEYDIPGADDPTIFADIVASLGRDFADVRRALGRLSALGGAPFADLDETRRQAVAASFQAEAGPPLAALSRAVLQCYYRDDRVVLSLGMETRAPFPKGHVLEQGDWSLLDPVRTRPKMWRDVPPIAS